MLGIQWSSHQIFVAWKFILNILIGIFVLQKNPPAPSAVGPELFRPKDQNCLRCSGSSGAQTGGQPASPRGKPAARATAAGTHGGRRQRGWGNILEEIYLEEQKSVEMLQNFFFILFYISNSKYLIGIQFRQRYGHIARRKQKLNYEYFWLGRILRPKAYRKLL